MCVQLTHVLYSVVITWQSNPPISQFNSPCNEFMSVWSMFVYNTYTLTHSFLVSKQMNTTSVSVWLSLGKTYEQLGHYNMCSLVSKLYETVTILIFFFDARSYTNFGQSKLRTLDHVNFGLCFLRTMLTSDHVNFGAC